MAPGTECAFPLPLPFPFPMPSSTHKGAQLSPALSLCLYLWPSPLRWQQTSHRLPLIIGVFVLWRSFPTAPSKWHKRIQSTHAQTQRFPSPSHSAHTFLSLSSFSPFSLLSIVIIRPLRLHLLMSLLCFMTLLSSEALWLKFLLLLPAPAPSPLPTAHLRDIFSKSNISLVRQTKNLSLLYKVLIGQLSVDVDEPQVHHNCVWQQTVRADLTTTSGWLPSCCPCWIVGLPVFGGAH